MDDYKPTLPSIRSIFGLGPTETFQAIHPGGHQPTLSNKNDSRRDSTATAREPSSSPTTSQWSVVPQNRHPQLSISSKDGIQSLREAPIQREITSSPRAFHPRQASSPIRRRAGASSPTPTHAVLNDMYTTAHGYPDAYASKSASPAHRTELCSAPPSPRSSPAPPANSRMRYHRSQRVSMSPSSRRPPAGAPALVPPENNPTSAPQRLPKSTDGAVITSQLAWAVHPIDIRAPVGASTSKLDLGPVSTLPHEASSVPDNGKGPKYRCTYCNKLFNRPSSLKIHINTHTGARPFTCTAEGCNRTFSVLSNMRRHAKTHGANAPSSNEGPPSPRSPSIPSMPPQVGRQTGNVVDDDLLEGLGEGEDDAEGEPEDDDDGAGSLRPPSSTRSSNADRQQQQFHPNAQLQQIRRQQQHHKRRKVGGPPELDLDDLLSAGNEREVASPVYTSSDDEGGESAHRGHHRHHNHLPTP